MNASGISVIVCCYNSAARLPETIRHLALQQVPAEIPWEVIIINNSSTDDTPAIAKIEWDKYQLPQVGFKIVDEEKPGLSNAREKGINTSVFNYIVFCDDDNLLNKNYLNIAFNILAKNDNIAAVGGQSTAISDVTIPAWFESSKNNYAVGQQAKNSGDVTCRKYLWGSGITIRKERYIKAFLNFPSILTGRKGDELSSGEDSEMCMRFILMGYQLYYSDELIFKHYIAAERLTDSYNKKLVEGFITAYHKLNIYSRLIDIINMGTNEKYGMLLKSALRVLIGNTIPLNRWNMENEKLNVYLLSGYKPAAVGKDIVSIRNLTKNKS